MWQGKEKKYEEKNNQYLLVSSMGSLTYCITFPPNRCQDFLYPLFNQQQDGKRPGLTIGVLDFSHCSEARNNSQKYIQLIFDKGTHSMP